MTLAQLRSFAAVARLGSVRAAAAELGVTEPAISGAVAALRREFGDELFVREGAGIAITPGGRQLAGRAREILGLAQQAHREVAEAHGAESLLRVAASTLVAEDSAPPLLDALALRLPRVDVAVVPRPAEAFADLLATRSVEVVLGPRPIGPPGLHLASVPFLRHQMVVVAAADHRLAGRKDLDFTTLAGEPWLAGPLGIEPLETEGRWLARQRLWPRAIQSFPSHAAALAAAAAGEGVTFAPLHTLRRASGVARLEVRGTPAAGFWYASALGRDGFPPAVQTLLRFVTTPDATQAVLNSTTRPAARFRPPVYITLWS